MELSIPQQFIKKGVNALGADRIISIIFMLIGSIFYYKSFSYPHESTIYVRFILIILMFLSVLLFIWPKQQKKQSLIELFSKQRIMALLLTIAYIILIPIIGYFVSTFIFLITFMWSYNHKGLPKYLMIAAGASIGIYVLFQKFLTVWFPTGLFM